MKKHLFFVLLLAIANALYSQEFRVKSMLELTHDLSARTSPRMDNTGNECAIIRVNTPTIKDVFFQSPIIGDPIHAPGEYTVYVPVNTERLQMICDNQQVEIIYSDYNITLQPKSTYRAVVTKELGQNDASGHVKVTVTANYDDDILLVDGIPAGQLPLIIEELPIGEHTFGVPNTNGRTLHDTTITISTKTKSVFLSLKNEIRLFAPLEIDEYYSEGSGEYIEPRWKIKYEKKNGKQGLVAIDGSIIVPFEYDEISNDYGGYYVVRKRVNGTLYDGVYIPGKGEVMPCRYTTWWRGYNFDILYAYEYGLNGDHLYNTKTDTKWVRLFDCKKGKFILSGNYTDVNVHDNKYITAVDEGQNTIIMNMSGKQLLTIPYSVSVFFDPVGELAVKKWSVDGTGDECLIYDMSGKTYRIPSQYNYRFHSISDGLLCVEDINTHKVGFITKEMKEIIPLKYYKRNALSIGDYSFKHGIISLETDNGDQVVFNNTGEIIAQTVLGGINSYKTIVVREDGRIICEKNSGEYGVIDSTGRAIVPFTRKKIEDGFNNFYIEEAGNYVTIINNMGKPILPRTQLREMGGYINYWVDETSSQKAMALTDAHVLMYNNDGQCIVRIPISSDAEYAYLPERDENGRYRVGIKTGNSIVYRTNDDSLFLIKNILTNKTGFLSATGELLTSCIYDEITEMMDIKGYIDSVDAAYEQSYGEKPEWDGDRELEIKNVIIPYSASEGYGIVGVGGRYGYINTKGKVVVPLIYTAVTPFISGVAYVRDQNNKWTKIFAKDLERF